MDNESRGQRRQEERKKEKKDYMKWQKKNWGGETGEKTRAQPMIIRDFSFWWYTVTTSTPLVRFFSFDLSDRNLEERRGRRKKGRKTQGGVCRVLLRGSKSISSGRRRIKDLGLSRNDLNPKKEQKRNPWTVGGKEMDTLRGRRTWWNERATSPISHRFSPASSFPHTRLSSTFSVSNKKRQFHWG